MLNSRPLSAVARRVPLNRDPRQAASTIPFALAHHDPAPGDVPAAIDRPQQLRILIVDDDASVRRACAEIATGLGYQVQMADSVPSARSVLAQGAPDLVLLDMKLPGNTYPNPGGLVLLEEIRARQPETVIVVMTAFATVDSAVEAMRIGAGDYLTKPFSLEELSNVLERSAQRRAFDLESRKLRDRMRSGTGLGNLVGHSPAMEKLYRIVSKVSHSSHPVLITGEAGTGKELVARSIHNNGPTANKPFIPVDCGSLVPALMEVELFGHVQGAFAGATRAKTGLLAAADGGTVFLNEIGELPLDLQGRLLRTLQEKEVRPVGANFAVPLAARILTATNRDLTAMVENGRFRKDLYFRLNIVSLRIPPLRERKSDIPLLAAHVLERSKRDNGIAYTFSDDSLHLMMSYDWPGNVRELEQAIERACALASGSVLRIIDFPTQMQDHQRLISNFAHALPEEGNSEAGGTPNHQDVLSIAEMEKQAILNTIRHLNGDKIMAARLLGIGKTTLYRKLKEYGFGDDQGLI